MSEVDEEANEASEYFSYLGNVFYMFFWALWNLGKAIRSDFTDLYYWVGRKIGYLPPADPKIKKPLVTSEEENKEMPDEQPEVQNQEPEEVKKAQ